MSNTQTRIASFIDHQIKRRSCSLCDGIMTLTYIEPGAPGFDVRTFECRDCRHVENHLVQIDPTPSEAGGWASSHLRASR